MKLTDEQQIELTTILSNTNIQKLLYHIQVCLLTKELTPKIVKRSAIKVFNDIIRKEKIIFKEQELFKNRSIILAQLIDNLKLQHNSFANHFAKKIILNAARDARAHKAIQTYIEYAIEEVKNAANFLNLSLPNTFQLPYGETESLANKIINETTDPKHIWHIISRCAIALTVILAIHDLLEDEIDLTFTARNVLVFFIACFIEYHVATNLIGSTFEAGLMELPDTPINFNLEIMDIYDLKINRPIEQQVYLSTDSYNTPQSETSEKATAATSSSTQTLMKMLNPKNKPSTSQNNSTPTATIPRAPAATVSWPAKNVWFGKENEVITAQQTQMLWGAVSEHGSRYCIFLNTRALRKQGLTDNHVEWKDYSARSSLARVVPPKGQSGIKQLRPAIGIRNISIANQTFPLSVFAWSAKTVTKLHRGLARNCSSQLSADGTVFTLVDMCYHMPKGPGK